MIITDSLGQPRYQDNLRLNFKETWPYLIANNYLHNKDIYVPTLTRYGLDSKQLVKDIAFFQLYEPNFIIVQIGIVDCSRRTISENMLKLIKGIPGLNRITKPFFHRYHYQLTRLYKITYTTEDEYFNNLKIFIESFQQAKILILPILPVGKNMIAKSFDITNQINKYNKKLEILANTFSNASFLDVLFPKFEKQINELTFSDSYHLNHLGHKLMYEELTKILSSVSIE